MVASQWMLLLGIPTIITLSVLAWRRIRAIATRIAEIQEEAARNPHQNPYQALSEIIEEQNKPASSRVRKNSMATGLTERQQEVFNFLVGYIEDKGYPPTIREMQVGLEIGSLRGVTIHLDALHKKGFIERLSSKNGPRTSRGIRILARLSERSDDEQNGVLRLPVIGTIAAGTPLLATQNIDEIIPVPMQFLRGKAQDCFLLRVKGDSMSGAHIVPDDLVIIQPQITAEHGDIIAARIGEEATVKRFWRHGNKIELHSQNPNYAPIPLRRSDNAAIIGKVVGLLRGSIK